MLELLKSPRRFLLLLFEGALIAVFLLVAATLRMGMDRGLLLPHIGKKAIFMSLIFLGSLYYAGLYDLGTTRTPRAVVQRTLQGIFVGSVVLWGLFYLVTPLEVGRGIFLATIAMTAVLLPAWRILYNAVSRGEGFVRKVLILGNGELAQELCTIVRGREDLALSIVGMLARDKHHVNVGRGIIGTYRDLAFVVDAEEVEVVLVAYPDRRGTLPVEQLLELKFRGVEVEEGVQFYEREMGKIYVRELKPSQLIFSEGFAIRPTQRRLKRLLDVFCATLGLVLAAPLMLLAALAIKVESPGPIFYKQIRSGQFGRLFTIYKFRSMRTDAEKHGAQFAKENDPRVTRVGAFLRKSRIDELPQLWNVLHGDMSMVGPRPERPVFVEQLEQQIPYFKQRLYVKPGVTGHAQVRCRYGASAEDMLEKLQYDLYYIKSCSLIFDLSIMFDTVKVVLLRVGAR